MRTLVFIVAYEAERHLTGVLERVPADLWNSADVHFLIIDDASRDGGVASAGAWLEARGVTNATVLRNPVNQGYGGNQKLGYRIAIDAEGVGGGFDFVILLHGDGQYAPELLPLFIETRRETGADVILGSRMHSVASARRGGMPWFKVVGNRMLTVFQNAVTGRKLSEYHTGYRGYSTAFLRKAPFELNTNQFHFDTEILLQAFHAGAKVVEVNIPTHYGDEICRVDGVRYARDVVAATLRYRMHTMGMLCDLRYQRDDIGRYVDKTAVAYTSHSMALAELRVLAPRTVLDLGCGPGFVAGRLRREIGADVTGADAQAPLPDTVNRFLPLDLEQLPLPVDAFSYDAVLLLDVIEHLRDPEGFLLSLRNTSRHIHAPRRPALVLSTPNVAFAAVRLNLLLGRFNYAERGILDVTHKRLFTKSSLVHALRTCGYEVARVKAVPVPFGAVMGGRLGAVLGAVSAGLARVWPRMFAFQWLVVAYPMPGTRQLLADSEKHRLGPGAVRAALEAPAETR